MNKIILVFSLVWLSTTVSADEGNVTVSDYNLFPECFQSGTPDCASYTKSLVDISKSRPEPCDRFDTLHKGPHKPKPCKPERPEKPEPCDRFDDFNKGPHKPKPCKPERPEKPEPCDRFDDFNKGPHKPKPCKPERPEKPEPEEPCLFDADCNGDFFILPISDAPEEPVKILEPTTLALFGLGALGLLFSRRKNK